MTTSALIRYLILLNLLALRTTALYATLAGGRPNAFSEGQNAFAGVVNPANAVWIADRIDIGAFWVHQKSSLNNHNNKPLLPPGKVDFTYRTRNLFTEDIAFHKRGKISIGSNQVDGSFSLATYTMPSFVKLRTKMPLPFAGTTPFELRNRIDVITAVFSLKLNSNHSIGISVDYLHFTHRRNGFQNSDNAARSVSPAHVTNKGNDHSGGVGCTIGWRWLIMKDLNFGAAWSKKSYAGRFRRYRGFEPHHARNFTPQLAGAGLSYRFNSKIGGRIEVLWSNQGDLPNANNGVLPDGSLNLNKRGSNQSPGPGLRDATYINIGLGYIVNKVVSLGAGYSHRLRPNRKNTNILSHTYTLQTIYDTISFGTNFVFPKHELFFGITYGFKNIVTGYAPVALGGGKFTGQKQNASFSASWGYKY